MTVQNENSTMVVEEKLEMDTAPKRKRDVLKTKKGVAVVASGVAVAAGVVTGAIVGGRKLIKKH